jgi:ATP dependent DNA ligase-like protein
VPLPIVQPLPLTRRPGPFSHPDSLFEVKYDGFRALAYADPSGVRLISRKGNRFSSFSDLCAGIELFLKAKHAILDGEIVCLDDQGHSQFNELLFRRGIPGHCLISPLRFRLSRVVARARVRCRSGAFSWPPCAHTPGTDRGRRMQGGPNHSVNVNGGRARSDEEGEGIGLSSGNDCNGTGRLTP